MAERIDKELEEFRRVMEVPSTFEEGFKWSSVLGALFVAIIMVPGAIYMSLVAGMGIGGAAQWVTLIMFMEVARRAHKHLAKAEIFVLFFMAGTMVSGLGLASPVLGGALWNQFFIRSDAANAYGIAQQLPRWVAPAIDSESYKLRTFFHLDWLPVILMGLFGTFFGQLQNVIMGYGLFRLTSDIEKLPFPMAPVGAQGIMALAEDAQEKTDKSEETSWRWRVFAIGGAMGLTFGSIYILLPLLSGALTGTSMQIFPIPFSDFTQKTGEFLPAVATGLSWDFGNLILGMVMPFFGMLGGFIGLIITVVLNPVLYHFDILESWKPGDSTVQTLFNNNVDFYFSFQIGIALALAVVGFWQVIKTVREKRKSKESFFKAAGRTVPAGRGDIRSWIIMCCYVAITTLFIVVSALLLRWHHQEWNMNITRIVWILLFLGFIYTPIISYVTARLEGMVGQAVSIPYIYQAAIILSGYKGIACWFIPTPMANYGMMTVFYRQCELTGTKFTSIWKTKLILYPIIIVGSIFFLNFIWGFDKIPSDAYPYAQRMWELNARNACVMYSATTGEYSLFERAFDPRRVGLGAFFGVTLFAGMWSLNAPIMMTYGIVRGLGQTMPHSVIPQFIGALIGHFYFKKRLKLKWRQIIPVVFAGFSCGVGLISTAGVGITFISKAAITLQF